jgi:hypothetical protein
MADFSGCCQILVLGRRFTLDMKQVSSMLAKLAAAGVPDASLLRGILEALGPGQVLDASSSSKSSSGIHLTPDAFAEVLRYAQEPGAYLLPPRADRSKAFRAQVLTAFDFFGVPAQLDACGLVSFRKVRWTLNRLAVTLFACMRSLRVSVAPRFTGPDAVVAFMASSAYRDMLWQFMAMNDAGAFALADRAIKENIEVWKRLRGA